MISQRPVKVGTQSQQQTRKQHLDNKMSDPESQAQQKTDIMRELTEDQVTEKHTALLLSHGVMYFQAERTEKLISAYKNYKILIISVITFVFIFIIALLIAMFVFS